MVHNGEDSGGWGELDKQKEAMYPIWKWEANAFSNSTSVKTLARNRM